VGITVAEPGDYVPALERALIGLGSTVIDVIVDPDAYPPITLFENMTIRRRKEFQDGTA
jgi:acetolactate synthase-1/2/3 large subunit